MIASNRGGGEASLDSAVAISGGVFSVFHLAMLYQPEAGGALMDAPAEDFKGGHTGERGNRVPKQRYIGAVMGNETPCSSGMHAGIGISRSFP